MTADERRSAVLGTIAAARTGDPLWLVCALDVFRATSTNAELAAGLTALVDVASGATLAALEASAHDALPRAE